MFPRTKGDLSDELGEWVEDLNLLGEGSLVVVEGKKDEKTLKNIGVGLPIVHLNKGMSILNFLESIKLRHSPFDGLPKISRIVIMTDWDRTGNRLSSRMFEGCSIVGMGSDLEMRRRLISLTGKYIKTVESLDSLMNR